MHPSLLRVIADAAGAAGGLETGGPLIGTVQRSWPQGQGPSWIVSVLGTVPPGPRLRATEASVGIGRGGDGERAAAAIRWWRSVTRLDLVHLGDWHRHDSGHAQPSAGDRATAEEMRELVEAPVWISAIAVGERSQKEELEAKGELARISRVRGDFQHVHFYRQTNNAGLAPIKVTVEARALPCLPALPWHVCDPLRFAAECRLLAAAGFHPAIERPDDVREAARELRLALRRDGCDPLIAVTGRDYPHARPALLDHRGRRLPLPGRWSADRFLVDLVAERG